MKKILLLLIFIFYIPHVDALNMTDITNDAEIKFKWYQNEITESLYYPKKDDLPEYLEDVNKIEYGEYSEWDSKYCDYDSNYYVIENKTIKTYDKLAKIKYIRIANASTTCPTGRCTDDVKIYYNHENIEYKVLSDNYFGLLVELPDEYEPEKLIFYIKTEHLQVIYLSKTKDIPPVTIASPASSENVIFLNNNWRTTDEAYMNVETTEEVPNIPLIKNIKTKTVCRIKEIKTYRYKITKNYYDDNYYHELEGYIPDITNYQINYTKPFPETKEVIKKVLVPQIEKEYIYLTDENNDNQPEKELDEEEKIVYKTEYVDRITNKVPKKIYIIIIIMTFIISLLSIKILTKYVD